MRYYYSADAIREAEAPLLASLPDGALMRRAANGLANAIARELVLQTGGIAGRSVCAVVGSGDNGGDALWAVTFLRRRGAAAAAVLLNPERANERALAAFRKAGGRVVQSVPATSDLVIDGVVGISGSGPLRAAAAELFAAVDAAAIPVVAVDIPSGVDVNTGTVSGAAVNAALTVTFGGLKPVHALGDCGRVELVDIGLDLPPADVMSFDAADVAARWPMPGPKDGPGGQAGALLPVVRRPARARPPGDDACVHRRGRRVATRGRRGPGASERSDLAVPRVRAPRERRVRRPRTLSARGRSQVSGPIAARGRQPGGRETRLSRGPVRSRVTTGVPAARSSGIRATASAR